MNSLASIAIVANPWYRHFFADLGARLRDTCGSKLHVYSVSDEGVRIYRDADRHGVFTSFSVMPSSVTYVPRDGLDESAEVAKASAFECKYGLTYNSLLVPDRLFGRGYAPGGYYHPRSVQSERGRMVHALHCLNQQFEFWEREFEAKGIGTMMEVNFPLQAAVARRHGALIRNPTSSRHKNLYYWTSDEFGYCDTVAQIYHSRRALAGEALAGVPYQSKIFNAEARRRFRLGGALNQVAIAVRNQVTWKLSGYFKGRQYLLRDHIELVWRRWRDYRRMVGPRTTRLADLNGKPFVFYGLHVEPELWFQGRSPEFFYQLSAIISLSRDLPAGVLLAVKEHHPAVGRRPDRFYDQILELKNVVLLNIEEQGLEIVRQAAAVATICGTVGQEAAVMGKPVVTFGRHNLYNILGHVRLVTREEGLKPALAWALRRRDDPTAQRAGKRFLGAVVAASFDMKDFSARSISGHDEASVGSAHDRLLESLESEDVAAVASPEV